MDSFTEKILIRARERQRLLTQITVSDDESEPVTDSTTQVDQIIEQFSKQVAENTREIVDNASSHTCIAAAQAISVNVSKADEGNIQNNNRISQQSAKTLVISNCQNTTPFHSKSLNIKRDDFDMEITLKSSSENVQLQVEIEETEIDSPCENICRQIDSKAEGSKDREEKAKLTGIDELKSLSAVVTSNVNTQTGQIRDNKNKQDNKENLQQRRGGLKCLANLAQNINQWEDEIKIPRKVSPKKGTFQKRNLKPPAPQPPTFNTAASQKATNVTESNASNKINTEKEIGCNKDSKKQLQLDKNLVETLESQGFKRTTSNSHLIYKYKLGDNKEEKNTTAPPQIIGQKIKGDIMAENTNPNVKRIVSATPASPSKGRAPLIADKAQIFEISSPSKTTKDPALLSVSERRALFEKNKEVVIPKAPLGMPVPVHSQKNTTSNVKVQPRKSPLKKYPAPKRPDDVIAPSQQTKVTATSNKLANSQSGVTKTVSFVPQNAEVTVPQAGGIASMTAALLQGKSTISQSSIESSIRQERQKEMDMLLNRFNKNKTKQTTPAIMEESDDDNCSEKTPMIDNKFNKIECLTANSSSPLSPPGQSRYRASRDKSLSPKVAAVLEDVKRIKVSPSKAGRLYPSLSDIEATPTETESEDYDVRPSHNNSSYEDSSFESRSTNDSFRREVIQAVIKNQTPIKRSLTDDSDISDRDYTDDGSNISSSFTDDNEFRPTPPKQSRTSLKVEKHPAVSNSFHYKNYPSNENATPLSTTTKTDHISATKPEQLPSYIIDDDKVLPLQHTVSFYRKQQSQEIKTTTPKNIIKHTVSMARLEEDESPENDLVEQKMQKLQDDINQQLQIISQTSRAINHCSYTMEFMGSKEMVEAERVLLVATHKRQVVLNELQRLSIEKTLVPMGKNGRYGLTEKGTLSISNITLPLKREYVRALVAAGGMGHHIVCLIKCCELVIATKLVSTVAISNKTPDFEVNIPGKYTLNNIYSENAITFEVYCLQAQEEMPHDMKYHIGKKASSKLTPKKSKQENRLIKPKTESPAGPNAVRSPAFALMGYVVLQVQDARKKYWSLNNVPPMSPLEGTAELCITYQPDIQVEHRGFLTVFEDISGFGAWHRRWYVLKGHILSYWKYPDDERKVLPIDTIDLRNCVTEEVGPVSREICARLNTFIIELERPAYPNDKDSLVTVCKGNKTILRHLFSADTKEERIEWCNNLNAALKVTRSMKAN